MRRKQGISLIVLVITIIVMIILAASVVIALNNTGIIDKANTAVKLTDEKQVQDLAALMWAEAYLDENRTDTIENVVKDKLEDQGVTDAEWNINVTDTGVTVTKKENTDNDSTVTANQLSGTWIFNETLTQTGWASGTEVKHESLKFYRYYEDGTLSTTEYTSLDYYPAGTLPAKLANSSATGCCAIFLSDYSPYGALYNFSCTSSSGPCITVGQVNSGYKTILFKETQTVSEEFYNWFTANATQQ